MSVEKKQAATFSLALEEAARGQRLPPTPSQGSVVTTERSASGLSCTKLPLSLRGLWGALSCAIGYCSRSPLLPPTHFYSSPWNPIVTFSLDLPAAVRHWALWVQICWHSHWNSKCRILSPEVVQECVYEWCSRNKFVCVFFLCYFKFKLHFNTEFLHLQILETLQFQW